MQLLAELQRKTTKEVAATQQDIKYARLLAGNNKTIRDRAVKSLRKWFAQRSKASVPFQETDLMLIWKGLFYAMWMSDKPLIQEECAENISSLIHSLDATAGFHFFKAGMQTLANEWNGIDQWRYDKFLMLVRRLLRQTFNHLKNHGWALKLIKVFASALEESILCLVKQPPYSLLMHFCDIYMPELAKVSAGELNVNILVEFVRPFVKALAGSSDQRVIKAISDDVLRYLMRQSDVAMEYEGRFEAWKKLGFPGGKICAMQKASKHDLDVDVDGEDDDEGSQDVGEEEEERTGLDPRAGRVNVVLPQMGFSCKNLMGLLTEYRFQAANTRARSAIHQLVQQFADMAHGDYPLGIKRVELYDNDGATSLKKSARKLVEFENKLYGRNRGKRQRAKGKEVEDVEDVLTRKRRLQVGEEETEVKRKKTELRPKSTKVVQAKEAKVDEAQINLRPKVKVKRAKEARITEELPELKPATKRIVEIAARNAKGVGAAKLRAKWPRLHAPNLLRADDAACFLRNSGVWTVTEQEASSDSEGELDSPGKTAIDAAGAKSDVAPSATPLKSSNSIKHTQEVIASTPWKTTPTTKQLFDTSAWDADLLDGEVELFVPSRKYLAKCNSLGAASPKGKTSLVEKSFTMIKGKGRRKSVDAGALNAVGAGTPRGGKKVQINLKQNRSQEEREYYAQVRCSPGIPFDAKRKPERPVIKANAMPSPINPFYVRSRRSM